MDFKGEEKIACYSNTNMAFVLYHILSWNCYVDLLCLHFVSLDTLVSLAKELLCLCEAHL